MKTAYLACFIFAGATHYYAFAADGVPSDAASAASCASLVTQPCLPGGPARVVGFNAFLRH